MRKRDRHASGMEARRGQTRSAGLQRQPRARPGGGDTPRFIRVSRWTGGHVPCSRRAMRSGSPCALLVRASGALVGNLLTSRTAHNAVGHRQDINLFDNISATIRAGIDSVAPPTFLW